MVLNEKKVPTAMSQTRNAQRIVIYLVVIAGLGGLTYLGVTWNAPKPVTQQVSGPVVVEAVEALPVSLQDTVTAVGSLRSAESVMIKSEIAGRISMIGFSDGSRVAKGDRLISFDSAIQKAQVMQAKAEHVLAETKLRRARELTEKQFLAPAALDEALANEAVAKARLALAEANLEKMTIRAPFAGTIGIRQVSVGDYIKEGVELVSLEDTSTMKIDFRVPEQVMNRLKVGQTVNLLSDAHPGVSFSARVTALDASIDSAGRSLLVRAVLSDSSRRLKPGMFLRAALVVAMRDQALVVPEEAVVTQQGRLLVFKVVDGKAQGVPVKTGLRTQIGGVSMVEITQGVDSGDLIVTAGQLKLRGPNVPVKIAEPFTPQGSAKAESSKSLSAPAK